MNLVNLDYKLLQKVAEVMPCDIFRQILLYVYVVEVEDVSTEDCCSKSLNCATIATTTGWSPRQYGLCESYNACQKHRIAGMLKIKSIYQCVTITIPRSSFNIFNRKDIKNVNFDLKLHGTWDELSRIKTTETAVVIDAGFFTTTIFAADKYEIMLIKNKISTLLLRWYDLCMPVVKE